MSDTVRSNGLTSSQIADVLVRGGSSRAIRQPLTLSEAAALSALLSSRSYQTTAEAATAAGSSLGNQFAAEDAFERFVGAFDRERDVELQLARFGKTDVPHTAVPVDVLQALNRFTAIVTGFIPAQWFRTACNAQLFDRLDKGPLTADELADSLEIKRPACASFLHALTELGLLEQTGNRWGNSDLGRLLTSSSEVPFNTLGTWVEIFYPMWPFLWDAMKEGTPRYEQALRTSAAKTWEALFADADRLRLFCRFMNAYSIPIGRQMAQQFSFSHVRRTLDVAGGAGGLSAQIGLSYPHLSGIVMDLPPVCEMAREYITSVGLSDRFTAVPVDLFDGPYPPGADAVILSWILHDWSDEKCGIILRNCFDALPSGGTLLISEIAMREDGVPRPFGNIMNMHMLIACDPGAKERTESEYGQLLGAAGFHRIEITRLTGPRDLIVARKP